MKTLLVVLGLIVIMQIVLIGVKAFSLITWPWWIVVSPLIAIVAIVGFIYFILSNLHM